MNTRLEQMSALLSREAQQKANPHMTRLSKYVEMRNNRYYLDLSKRECQNLGISLSEYERMKFELQQTNQHMLKVERNKSPYNSLELAWPRKNGGTITTDGQEERFDSAWAPTGSKFVRFKCRANAALGGVFACTVKTHGETKRATGGSVRVLKEYSIIDIPLNTSNDGVEVSFKTLDSNGGSCDWMFMK